MSTTVLVVDDHATFRRFARRLLTAGGFDVVGEAEDGSAAVAAVRELKPALVLLDVLLPDRSGLDVARELAALPDAPAVILTSSRGAEDYGAALDETPAFGFLPKAGFTAAAVERIVTGA